MHVDFTVLREAIASLDAHASSSTTGQDRPHPDQIFAPEHHVGALDPNATIVLGARGTGKSFWAGVLANEDTRKAAAKAFPRVGLETLLVGLGFTGQDGDGSVSRATIDAQIAHGKEGERGRLFWRCAILRAVESAIYPETEKTRISAMMDNYLDPEAWEEEMLSIDKSLFQTGRRVLVLFDALDSLALEWTRLRGLTDALLEVAWSLRGYRSIRGKLFLRPDQLVDLGLRFVELPKMMSGATKLIWAPTDLYGMFFSRLATTQDEKIKRNLKVLLEECSVPLPPPGLIGIRRWRLSQDKVSQVRVFKRLAGEYMGRSNKKGRTYDWALNHLADGHGEVTPRSFMTLMRAASHSPPFLEGQAITAEGIRVGLREASKVRLEQLDTEFKWIKRVLAPLARLQVPCTAKSIFERWEETETISAIKKRASAQEFLTPFEPTAHQSPEEQLIGKLQRMGVLKIRTDGRYDMPDLFRVAARLLKKGSVAPV